MKNLLLALFTFLTVSAIAQGNREISIDFSYIFSGTTPVSFGASTHTHTDGAEIRFDAANYYVSNIRLVPTTGPEVAYDTILLITDLNAGQPFMLGQVPVGEYQTIKFDIGMDSARNHGDPTIYPFGHPLALSSQAMHWSWNSGYIFMKVDGQADTTAAQTGIDVTFAYHIGGMNFRREVSVPIDLEVDINTQLVQAHIDFQLSTLLTGLDIMGGNDLITHTMGNLPLANTVINNAQSAFIGEVEKTQITSVGDVAASQLLSLYPNPMTQNTTLKFATLGSNAVVTVLSLSGKTIFTQPVDGNQLTLERSQFPAAGVYLVKVQGVETAVRKLVVY